jgi:uncharacterized membrane protein YeaQ/YmgE (transglycosylase-associated protein family)
MQEIYNILIGISVLFLGFFIGNFLARTTKDELKNGQKWFKLIILVCAIGAIITLFLGNDALLFSFLFFMVVTSRSLKR